MTSFRGCFLVPLFLLIVSQIVYCEFCPFTVDSYVGCFSDQDNNASFVPYDSNDPSISPVTAEECACKCGNQGYQYSALQNLNECHCTNWFDVNATSNACASHCVDNTTQLCGGFDDGTTSVYSVYLTTVGCHPPCNENQTCQLFDSSYYMCTPSCEFSADFVYNFPCQDLALVYLNISSSTFHGTSFTYSLDDDATQTGDYNTPIPFTFQTGITHSFLIKNVFGCSVVKNITLPTPTIPSINAVSDVSFDISMNMEARYYKLLYPSQTGNVQLGSYTVEYRYSCPDSGVFSDWAVVTQTDTTLDTINAPYQYSLQYDLRSYSGNCVGNSSYSDILSVQAPSSPFIPTIVSAVPQKHVPTTGGDITITGLYFTSSPTVYVDGVQKGATQSGDTQAVIHVGEGQGTHTITVLSFANFSCQEILSAGFSWSYAVPNVTGTSVLSNRGGALTITGNNFGIIGANTSVSIDDNLCSTCAVSKNHTTITCSGCPAGSGGDHHLIATVAGLSSASFDFTYALCDPMCIFGECVSTNVCKCDDGYGGVDCSSAHVCSGQPAPAGNLCGACTDTTVCCKFSSM
eukprot:Phypoly_transcript_06283.p1 GENE.Phypoly_transcript_06283~~Phypoly_transcript_06283.p1  ORF type:complete len:575 (+),score=55.64 Phypoly_transcript_06283:73-1797(+)